MLKAEVISSGGRGQLSAYELQRLENIKEMSAQFGDLIEEVSKSALDLAKTTSRPTATNSSNGNRRMRNCQQFRQVKLFSKGPKKPQSHPTRRSRRLINEQRKKPEYNERSDSDDENPSKVLRLKFPFFKKNEYAQRDKDYYNELDDADFIDTEDELMESDDSFFHSKRKHQVSMNTHQIPVSLITQEMLNNITYSSCKKKYDAVNGTTCHQCRQKTLDQKSYCRYKKCRGIRGMFCGFCLGKRYGEDVAEVLLNKKWACPPCRGYCNCSICRRKRGRSPTGQLSHIAVAGGYKSVKHLLETTEGGAPGKDLSSDYDSDESDQKGDQHPEIIKTESINNNVNYREIQNNNMNDYTLEVNLNSDCDEDDKKGGIHEMINNNNSNDDGIQYNDEIPKKKFKTENINEQNFKTEQNDSLVITENENGTGIIDYKTENNEDDTDNVNYYSVIPEDGTDNVNYNTVNTEYETYNVNYNTVITVDGKDNFNHNTEEVDEEIIPHETAETILNRLYQELFSS